ncbi:gamma-glutamylcyclotransferase [Paenibacillus glycanilyticus]|uniref:gamma-glutamylcyclotransferase family protein n=1 Tax=Paenibacillus glycanilyticus TaxID=126569 RepID=UPI002041281D|nr:gamma-glutamylcyclotransferase family protein [Paenibacillus glycanilyticus]MCM3628949.1 gamma-glutamylcyclotransferase [Paenibacillus glycanilyticus]
METREKITVFVYGSLLPGLINHFVIAPFLIDSEEGVIAGRLVDVGAYPAAVRDQAARLSGSLIQGVWFTIHRKGLAVLDELEEFVGIEESNDYERVWVQDERNPQRAGWVYIWPEDRGFPPVPGSFWPDHLDQLTSKPKLS